jgi:uncharacterized protein (TIGR02246 family)
VTATDSAVRAILDAMADAIRAKDVDALMAHYAADVVAFDLVSPLQYRGAATIRKRVSDWFSAFQGPIEFEMREVTIAPGDDVAFCHSLNGVRGSRKDGAAIGMWWRATLGFRKIDGTWRVTHGHSSEPFDMESGKALIDLKP